MENQSHSNFDSRDRVRLHVLGISYSQIQSGAYALILAQENGPYRIPVVVGAAEAQSIAIKMEGVVPPRPMTHDLFASLAQAYGVVMKDVFIHKFEDGIFSSELTFVDAEGREVVLDARTSDAIAIAMRTNTPIYTTRAILAETGFIMEMKDASEELPSDSDIAQAMAPAAAPSEETSLDELEARLKEHIDNEEYEEAARIQAIINKKKGK
ncbi:MAG: bifunctional nuclease domain-containing protein [Muribaculaceae bacterium]|nr:bifunctional nuclease domain-containing protein [Muribaculaceae bacterium]